MGIHHALYSGVTGLSVNSDGMSVIANNIANANTRSFKSDRAEFEDLLSVSLNEASQLGRGARLRNIQTSFSQGALANTGSITDLAIQGDGFFMMRNEGFEVKESGGMFYTRQGSFRFNKEGFITDVDGGKLQGYPADKDGILSSKLGDMQITANNVAPAATSKVTLNVNLDVRERAPREEFDVTRPGATSNHSSTVTLYDNMGRARPCTIYFARGQEPDRNDWNWYATVDGKDASDNPELNEKGEALPSILAQGNVEFDAEGKPMMSFKGKDGRPSYIDTLERSDAYDIQFAGSAQPQKIQFNFGPAEEDGALNNQSSTSMAARSSTLYHAQNGYEAGNLKSLKIDLDGSIRGVYTNGLERKLGAIALASFPNNHGLAKVGRNSYIAPPKAGEPRVGLPGTGTRGSIYASSLEESNVDLAQQFVDMITTQRAFQANSKSITTTDSMIEEVLGLKR